MSLVVDMEKRLPGFTLKMAFAAENETLALLGASGSGKSMTLKCIAGIVTPDRGYIEVDGRVLFDSDSRINLPPQQRRVGYLFQQYALFPHMTARQNLLCGVRGDKKRSGEKADGMLATLGLTAAADKLPAQLSGGEQQRIALGRILLNEPDILLLDEPFSALDSHLRFALEGELRRTIRAFGRTVVLVSHDRDEAYRLSDTMALVENGHVTTRGTKEAIFAQPRTRAGAALTGCKNLSPITLLPDGRMLADDWGVALAAGTVPKAARYVGIRMHAVQYGPGENEIHGAVTEVVENPFSCTVMVQPQGGKKPLGWEVDKDWWRGHGADSVTLHLPKDALLLLEE